MARDRRPAEADWENEESQPYRRLRRPIEVRRRPPWRNVLRIAVRLLSMLAGVAVVGGLAFLGHRFASDAAVFQLARLESVAVDGIEHVPRAAVRQEFAEDVGESVLAIPLQARRQRLENMAWVEAATVQRLLPNRLRVHIRERAPVAFLRQGSSLWLVDRHGVLLSPPEGASYSFPVLSGLSKNLPSEERRARLQLYLDLVSELDRDAANYSALLSEIDLRDPDDVCASITETHGAVWVHFGRGAYREKFETFLQHRSLWQRSGKAVRSVDLRYRGQIVLNPDASARKGSQ